MPRFSKVFIEIGILFIICGFVLFLFEKVGLFKLPGDIVVQKKNFTIYIPIVTSILISLILTIIINVLLRK